MSLTLELGGIVIPQLSALGPVQTYEIFGGVSLLRMMSGAARKQSHWRRLRTSISAEGWIPPGLANLDFSAALTLKCVAPRAVDSASNVIVIPAARRSDAPPLGFAIKADNTQVATTIAIATNTATVGVVAGAIGYRVLYWPQLTVFAEPATERVDTAGAVYGWDLTAEEI